MATREELAALDDPCAICWERMENARKLPCNHFFHKSVCILRLIVHDCFQKASVEMLLNTIYGTGNELMLFSVFMFWYQPLLQQLSY